MKKLRDGVSFPYFLVSLAIVTAVAFPFAKFSGLPFWACFAIVLGALLVNGFVAAWEDEQPGGFHNPTPHDSSGPTHPDEKQ